MTKNGVILSKLAIIEEYLFKLQDYLPVTLDQFRNDWGLQKITERSLQVMIETMIDIAERIIAKKNVAPPKTSADAVTLLQKLGVVKNSNAYIKMVRFRNLVVHDYASIDVEILYSILTNNLQDFRNFMIEIKNYEET
jgi:uncharacterized protein YutE (UPF0331/DUF86 family)